MAGLAVVLLFTTVDPWLDKSGILVGGLDAHIYRDGAERVVRGEPLYTTPTLRGLLYTYTPFSALAFLPAALVPWTYLSPLWLALNMIVLFTAIMLCWKILGYRADRWLAGSSVLLALTCVFLEPVRTTLYYGQINLMLMVLVLWDFSRGEGSRLRGVGTGLAAGIKLVPGYFIVQYLVLRQWRTAVTAALTFAATIAVAWAILPSDSRQYWLSTFLRSDRIAPDTHPSNQSLRGTLAHLSEGTAPIWLWVLVAGTVAAVSLLVVAALERRGDRLLAIALAGLTACAVSPFSWSHHWVWFVPLLVHLVHLAQSRPRWWVAFAALYLATAAWPYKWDENWVSIGLFLYPPWWTIAPVLMNEFILIYTVVLAAAAWAARDTLFRSTRRRSLT
ncbi:glycosyltransferase 87 family protein [Nocardia huaxiensis]|uniref:glycosyltransferase 87 family protein n=1 Tax=Nocardia huaxiensis TaxID=2755382 RepID=UPI001FD2EE40|nr:glycosyltransferase 87 family protein [Nocardia huaxiensis]